MSVRIGDLCYVEYHGYPGVFHTRLATAHIENDEWLIATPDLDLYPEELNARNGDISQFFHSSTGAIPRRVPRGSIYAFQPMTAQEYARIMSQGQRAAEAEKIRRGLGPAAPAGGGAGAAVAAPAAVGAPTLRAGGGDDGDDAEVWVLVEHVDGHKIGEELTLAAGSPQEGNHALVHVLGKDGKDFVVRAQKRKRADIGELCEQVIQAARMMEAKLGDDPLVSDDVRTLSIKYGPNGERCRTFRESIQEMRQVEMEEFPLSPRTCLEYLRAVAEISESCYGQRLSWVQNARIPEGDRAVFEDEVLSKVLDAAIKIDGLNVCNSLAFEMIVRRKQLLCEAHVGNPAQPSYEASDYFMGVQYRPGGGIVTPSLTERVAKRMHEESQVLKEKRKMREAKGSGKSKGKTDSPPQGRRGGRRSEEGTSPGG